MWPLVTAQRTAGSLRFFALLGMQTVGAAIMYWNVAPLYRQAIAAPTSLQVELETSISPLLAIALIQGGYWISRRTRPPLPQFTNFLLGQFILFVARMGFVLPTSIFGLVFITQNPGYQIPAFRYGVILVSLFSLYCYVQELERLGAFLSQRQEPDRREKGVK
jgi:hypothetical protein